MGEPAKSSASGLTDEQLSSCRLIICLTAATSGFQWQCYVPTLALLVTREFGQTITAVGWLYAAFVGTSILSSITLSAHLKYFAPYTLLWGGFAMRGLSGALHALGCLAATQLSMPLLIVSRILHGYTILLFPLSVVWIGARDQIEQRAGTLASRNAYSTCGIFLGIVSGASLAAVLPTELMAGAAPGYLNILVSAVMIVWLRASFADRGMLPVGKKKGADGQETPVPWLHVILVGFAQFFGWVGFVAIEGSLSLIVVREYGMTHQNVIQVWGPTSLAMLIGTFLFSKLHKAKWSAFSIAIIALITLPISFYSLFHDNLTKSRTSHYSFKQDNSLMTIAVFVLGLGGLLFAFAITNTLFNALLMQHLAPHQQAQFQTPVQTLAAVGRGIGPFLGTLIIAKGDEYRHGLGPPLMLAFAFTSIALSIVAPAAWCGRFFDPPKPRTAMW